MPKRIIVGNWKMNGTITETEKLISALISSTSNIKAVKIVVCPPFTSLSTASKLLQDSHIELGAQDMSEHENGAHTADISAEMLLTAGAVYVILGHSERRQYHAESDQLVNLKTKLAFSSGLHPILCVGESLEEREADKTEDVISAQIDGVTSGFGPDELAKSIIAYEPVWAIGTGRTATPMIAQEVHKFIRDRLSDKISGTAAEKLSIIYGGSVKAENAQELMSMTDINGALVGGASLKADEFVKIIQAT